jgi:hypothetical protein
MSISPSAAVLAIIKPWLCTVLTTGYPGEALDKLPDAIVKEKPLLTAGIVTVDIVKGAGGRHGTQATCERCALKMDGQKVAASNPEDLRSGSELAARSNC